MQRVDLVKHGFIRCQEEDFSDDGTRFTCYKAGRVVVSKATYQGDIFLSGHISSNKVPYDVYSKLPHYSNMDRLNGVAISSLTEEDIERLYDDCIAYDKEYTDAENSIVYPSLQELKNKCEQIRSIRKNEIDELNKLISKNPVEVITKLSKYDLESLGSYIRSLQNNYNHLDPEMHAVRLHNTSSSFDFIKSTYDLKPSAYYEWAKEILQKVV